MTSVLLADDHALFREGVRLLLKSEGFDVIGEAATGEEAVRMAEELSPDVIALDLGMPGLNGIQAAQKIRKTMSGAKIILLTMYEDEEYMLEALRVGVNGYVLKVQTDIDLVQTIRMVSQGAFYLGPNIPQSVIDALTNNTQLASESLTEREWQVVELIADGKTTNEIARVLELSPKTIESHRSRIMQKLNLDQTAQLVTFAVRSQMTRSLRR